MIEFVIAGAMGGLAKSLAEHKGRVVRPSIEESDDGHGTKVKYVHLGFLANMFMGATVAAYLTTEISSAFAAGISAAFIIEKLLEKTVVK